LYGRVTELFYAFSPPLTSLGGRQNHVCDLHESAMILSPDYSIGLGLVLPFPHSLCRSPSRRFSKDTRKVPLRMRHQTFFCVKLTFTRLSFRSARCRRVRSLPVLALLSTEGHDRQLRLPLPFSLSPPHIWPEEIGEYIDFFPMLLLSPV